MTQIIDDIHFAWQAQYLVKLDGDSCCAAQYRVVLAWYFVVQSGTGVVLCSTE